MKALCSELVVSPERGKSTMGSKTAALGNLARRECRHRERAGVSAIK